MPQGMMSGLHMELKDSAGNRTAYSGVYVKIEDPNRWKRNWEHDFLLERRRELRKEDAFIS